MSAAELRKAAESERAEWGGEQNARQFPTAAAIHLALADWLDRMARAVVGTSKGDVPFEDDALAIARLINGGAS